MRRGNLKNKVLFLNKILQKAAILVVLEQLILKMKATFVEINVMNQRYEFSKLQEIQNYGFECRFLGYSKIVY